MRPKLLLNLTGRFIISHSRIWTLFDTQLILLLRFLGHKKNLPQEVFSSHTSALKIRHGGSVAEAVGAKITRLRRT